ncbi:bile acid:sodium symporter family protein [Actinokineospora sp. PR83]|uniref:bile acid:sodium symporter family protein n=1 Tax=Actinokineospora sp. PR83 TaxID=2884908 RepID=UPI001F1C358E|nr:bile acid:sodium symporter family protein [Actinokineospora sp. PR83]MCG8917004.1 bile acid:sodium symporter family protein [Actinokineospora sp. PR83]
MASSTLTTVFLPIALAVVMLGLGLSLSVADFARVARVPKPALLALAVQVLLLPALALGLAVAFDLAPELAVGLMLLAAAPGGTTANIFSHLAGGDVALNVTLTAVNSVLAVVTLPLVVNLSIAGFLGADSTIGLQPAKTLQVFALVLVPVAVGMAVNRRFPGFAARARGPVKVASVVVLVGVILAAVFADRGNVGGYLRSVGAVTVLLCLLSLAIGYAVPLLAGVARPQAIASAFEIGLHNSTLAITVALSPALLDNAAMAVPAAVYGVAMFFPAGALAWWFARRGRAVAARGAAARSEEPGR